MKNRPLSRRRQEGRLTTPVVLSRENHVSLGDEAYLLSFRIQPLFKGSFEGPCQKKAIVATPPEGTAHCPGPALTKEPRLPLRRGVPSRVPYPSPFKWSLGGSFEKKAVVATPLGGTVHDPGHDVTKSIRIPRKRGKPARVLYPAPFQMVLRGTLSEKRGSRYAFRRDSS